MLSAFDLERWTFGVQPGEVVEAPQKSRDASTPLGMTIPARPFEFEPLPPADCLSLPHWKGNDVVTIPMRRQEKIALSLTRENQSDLDEPIFAMARRKISATERTLGSLYLYGNRENRNVHS